jgi:vacuolar protein-sorting-associated protein 4
LKKKRAAAVAVAMTAPSTFCDKGRDFIAKAIEADEKKDYPTAKKHYITALDYFATYLTYEKNKKASDVVRSILPSYLARAESITKFLNENPNYPPKGGATTAQDHSPGPNGSPATGSSAKPISAFTAEKCNISWDDVSGLPQAKAYIRQAAIIPLQMPHLFKVGGILEPWKGILLFGPPGTGKTFLAKAVSTEAQATFLSVSASDIFTKWVGESESQIKNLFQQARNCDGPCIIFFDEIDALCRSRTDSDSEVNRRVLTEMLNQMDGIRQNGDGKSRVMVMGATNKPWELDGGILRRFEKRVYIPLPEPSTRKAMLIKLFAKARENDGITIRVTEEVINQVVDQTDYFSAADISIFFKEALMNLVRKMEDATHFASQVDGRFVPCSPGNPIAVEVSWSGIADKSMIALPPLTDADILAALRNTKSSVVRGDLDQFARFAADMGVQG